MTWADSRSQRNHLRAPGWRSYFLLILDYGNDAAFEDFFPVKLCSASRCVPVSVCGWRAEAQPLPEHQAEALRSPLPHQAAPMGAAGQRAHMASLLSLEAPRCPPPHSPHCCGSPMPRKVAPSFSFPSAAFLPVLPRFLLLPSHGSTQEALAIRVSRLILCPGLSLQGGKQRVFRQAQRINQPCCPT